ncbi:cytochrome P450 84A1-like [Cornus florida]|uniref:cytochrome P450 84A1-like n=1 Tax=Cornus florida TaxID=4283 RepID=UPI00289B4B12|nr:cytochrome P450 84A1-like [Cornus florida]
MDSSSLQALQPLLSCFMVALIFLVMTFFSHSRPKLPYPPGPKGLPLIGNMLMMDQLTHRGLARLAKQYGGLLHLKMGRIHTVAVSTPDMAREVLQVQDNAFSNRPATTAISFLTYDRADMAFADYGPFWRETRKICVMKLFSPKRAESWQSVNEEVDWLMGTISAKVGSSVNVAELALALTKTITYRAAFGSISREGQDEFGKIIEEFSKLFGASTIGDFIPWLGWICGQKFNERLISARRSLDEFIGKIIDDHMAKKKISNLNNCLDEVDTDMVDELLKFYKENYFENESKDLQFSFKVTRDNIKALIMDVMFGGTETVASAIEWCMAELMKNPADLKKVQQELSNVVGQNRRVHESDLVKLTYLKCVIKETLRLHPPIPVLVHKTATDCTVAGYKIPAKSHVMINAWAIGRNKAAWDNPDTFKPSRFLHGDAPDFTGSNFQLIPFGSGRRSCPGMKLGLYTLELTVAQLCHCFTWELPDGMKPSELDMNDVFGFTSPRAIQLVAVPSHRLQC